MTEQILSALDRDGYLFPEFELHKEQGVPKLLGRGGFASVYEMRGRSRPDRSYALKVTGFGKPGLNSANFRTNVRLQSILTQESPYIVRILDARELSVTTDEDGGLLRAEDWTDRPAEQPPGGNLHLQCILMERLDEILVHDRFHRACLLREELRTEENVIRFALQVGHALATAHRERILHRDVKLENIFWDENARCYKLGDFGISKYTGDGNAETVVYTDGYGAPEVARKTDKSYNATADIYSFGITLYLLLNRLRFPGSDGYYARAEAQYNPEFIFPAPEDASPEMARIVRRMCSFRAADRYQSMAEVRGELAALAECAGDTEAAERLWPCPDAETETWHDEAAAPEDAEAESAVGTREKYRRTRERMYQCYTEDNRKYWLLLTVLFTLLLKGLQPVSLTAADGAFWVLPGCLLFACVLTNIPMLMLAGLCASGLWLWTELTGWPAFLDYLWQFDVGWVILAVVLFTLYCYHRMRIYWEQETFHDPGFAETVMGGTGLLLVIAGIAAAVLRLCGLVTIPDVLRRLHPVRTGLAVLIGVTVYSYFHPAWVSDEAEENRTEGGDSDEQCMDE